MRQFYQSFPILSALRRELSWTHYRMLMRVNDPKAREYYAAECAAAGWSSRELERQITTFAYQRTVSNQQHMPYMPTEEELRNELRLQELPALKEED